MPNAVPIKSVLQFSEIIDSVPTAIIIVDRDGKIVMVNMQAERLFGYSGSELHGEMVDLLVPGKFRGAHPELRKGFTEAPQARPMGANRDLFGLRKDGAEFPIEIGLKPINTEEGLFIVSAIVDISERKRLEARFRATVESAPTAMVMIDQTGTIVLVNAELERMFGYGREELLRQKIEVLIPQRYRSGHPGLRTQYLVSPHARRMGVGRELFGMRKDGSEFPIEIGLNPVRTDEGLFVLSAIVERVLQAEELRRVNEALVRSNIELQRFVHIASHDLQTPMRSIAGFVELLRITYQDALDERGNDWILRTTQSITYLQNLLKDLLEYSRSDVQVRAFKSVPMRAVFDDAVSMLDAAVRESGAEISCGELPEVMGDRSQLVQLMLNLLGNSLKYRGADPPRIHVSVENIDSCPVFVVRDNGIGIAAKYHGRIFELFQRLHDQKAYPGTGIGLAVCRRVVNHHGGRIWVESDVGHGSAFHFTLPGRNEGQP